MTLTEIEIIGFRSVRKLRLPLRQLTVLVGGNGVGKTNLYRSLELLHAAAEGTLAGEIAREGGLGSIYWAGGKNLSPDVGYDPKYRSDGFRRGEANRLMLEASLAGVADGFDPTYRIEVGFHDRETSAAFPLEAQIKEEHLELRRKGKPVELMFRKGRAVWWRNGEGKRDRRRDAPCQRDRARHARPARSHRGAPRVHLVAVLSRLPVRPGLSAPPTLACADLAVSQLRRRQPRIGLRDAPPYPLRDR